MKQAIETVQAEIFKLKNKISQSKRGLKKARTESQKEYWKNELKKFYDELKQKENILSDSSDKICEFHSSASRNDGKDVCVMCGYKLH